VSTTHWQAWHEPYDVPGSYLARRLAIVQQRLSSALDEAPSGPIRVVSMCAGQGRDLLGVLESHPRGPDVTARLVELDTRNAMVARAAAESSGLDQVEVVEGDAAHTDAYRGAVPAEVVMVCGVFGNVTDADVERTVATLPQLCTPGAAVIWTRHRREPDLTPSIRRWFRDQAFDEASFDAPDDALFSVGVHRYAGDHVALAAGVRMFEFVVGADGLT
jgi:hypothetical protein